MQLIPGLKRPNIHDYLGRIVSIKILFLLVNQTPFDKILDSFLKNSPECFQIPNKTL